MNTKQTVSNQRVFNFDLERMDRALAARTHSLPKNLTKEEFKVWVKTTLKQSKERRKTMC
jgi:hypothetical protein